MKTDHHTQWYAADGGRRLSKPQTKHIVLTFQHLHKSRIISKDSPLWLLFMLEMLTLSLATKNKQVVTALIFTRVT